jgi:hypothetical protein
VAAVAAALLVLLAAFAQAFDSPIGFGDGFGGRYDLADRLRIVARWSSATYILGAALACRVFPSRRLAACLRVLSVVAGTEALLIVYLFAFDVVRRGQNTTFNVQGGYEVLLRVGELAVALVVAVWAWTSAAAPRRAPGTG